METGPLKVQTNPKLHPRTAIMASFHATSTSLASVASRRPYPHPSPRRAFLFLLSGRGFDVSGGGGEKHIHLFFFLFSFAKAERLLADYERRKKVLEGCWEWDGILGCGITAGCPLGFFFLLTTSLEPTKPLTTPAE